MSFTDIYNGSRSPSVPAPKPPLLVATALPCFEAPHCIVLDLVNRLQAIGWPALAAWHNRTGTHGIELGWATGQPLEHNVRIERLDVLAHTRRVEGRVPAGPPARRKRSTTDLTTRSALSLAVGFLATRCGTRRTSHWYILKTA
jgi:hypothetical protein